MLSLASLLFLVFLVLLRDLLRLNFNVRAACNLEMLDVCRGALLNLFALVQDLNGFFVEVAEELDAALLLLRRPGHYLLLA